MTDRERFEAFEDQWHIIMDDDENEVSLAQKNYEEKEKRRHQKIRPNQQSSFYSRFSN